MFAVWLNRKNPAANTSRPITTILRGPSLSTPQPAMGPITVPSTRVNVNAHDSCVVVQLKFCCSIGIHSESAWNSGTVPITMITAPMTASHHP